MSVPEFPERFGRYTLLQRVAFGGMAEILLAIEDTAQEGKRFVTVKRIRSDFASDPDYIDFFIGEGRVSLRCQHPNLLESIELNTVEGVHFLAMEYFRGHTLLDLIRKSHKTKDSISIAGCLLILREVSAALEHLHNMRDERGQAMNVIHRDVTPQNIMIDATGVVKLIDLGIARSEVQVHKTQAGILKGKLSYVSPEQLIAGAKVDKRSDIFALGIVLFESLTNKGLFRGKDDRDTLQRVQKMVIPRVGEVRARVPAQVEKIVAKALKRDVNERFQSAQEFYAAVCDALAETQERGMPYGQAQLRDEVLRKCGDPPIPTLGGAAFTALRSALNAPEEPPTPTEVSAKPAGPIESAPTETESLFDEFISKGGVNVARARENSTRISGDSLHAVLQQVAEDIDKDK